MNIIRSSGTPCSFRISTAFIAEPPVAFKAPMRRMDAMKEVGHTQHRIKKKHVSRCDVFRKLQSIDQSVQESSSAYIYLGIEEFRESSLLILVEKLVYSPTEKKMRSYSLDQDLPNSHATAYFTKTSFHSLPVVRYNVTNSSYATHTMDTPRLRAGLIHHRSYPRNRHLHIWPPSTETYQRRGKLAASSNNKTN